MSMSKAEAADRAAFRARVKAEALAQGLDADLAEALAEQVSSARPPAVHEQAQAARLAATDLRELHAFCRVVGLPSFTADFVQAGMNLAAAKKLIHDDMTSLGPDSGRGVRVMARLHYLKGNR